MATFAHLHNLYVLYDAGSDVGLKAYRMYPDPAHVPAARQPNPRTLGAPCILTTGEPILDAALAPIAPDNFNLNDLARVIASFPGRPELEAVMRTQQGKDALKKMRSVALVLRTAGATKKVEYEGAVLNIVSLDPVANTVTFLPEFSDGEPLEGTNAHRRTIAMASLGGLRLHHLQPLAPAAAPPPAGSPVTAIKHELRIYKDQILTKSGEMQYRLAYYQGTPIAEGDEWGEKCARWATARDRPTDFSWNNPQVLFDGFWYPYAFQITGNDELAIRGIESGLRDFFSVQMNEETSTLNSVASKNAAAKVHEKEPPTPAKAPYPFYREKTKLVIGAASVLADLCRNKRPDALVLKQIEAIQDSLHGLMRRRGYPNVHPSAKDSMTPIWYWRAEQRASGLEKRSREGDLGLF